MNNFGAKRYFDPIFSYTHTIFSILVFTGQIAYLIFAFSVGEKYLKLEDLLLIEFCLVCPMTLLCLLLLIFGAWRYWKFDENGIENGCLVYKKKILYNEIDSIVEKQILITGRPFIRMQDCMCFYKKKKMVYVEIACLSSKELIWLESKTKNKKNNPSSTMKRDVNSYNNDYW